MLHALIKMWAYIHMHFDSIVVLYFCNSIYIIRVYRYGCIYLQKHPFNHKIQFPGIQVILLVDIQY